MERVNHRALTLVFSVDRIRLTVDILSSFRPVFRISGRSSDTNNNKLTCHPHGRVKRTRVHLNSCLNITFDFQYLANCRRVSRHQEGQCKLDKSHADIRSSLENLKRHMHICRAKQVQHTLKSETERHRTPSYPSSSPVLTELYRCELYLGPLWQPLDPETPKQTGNSGTDEQTCRNRKHENTHFSVIPRTDL